LKTESVRSVNRDDLERQIEPKIARGKACQESKVPLSKKVEEQSSHAGAVAHGTPRGRSEKFIWTHLA
jgi:hypothetical protein